MGFFLPFLFLLALTSGLISLTKKPFGICLPLVVLSLPLLPYLTGLIFGSLSIGFWIEIALAVAGGICILRFTLTSFLNRKSPSSRLFFNNFFSFGLVLFVFIYLFVYVHDLHRPFTHWDEFSHWGMMVRELLRLDTFYSNPDSLLLPHKDYPPFIALFEYIYCRLSGGFQEAYASRACHLLIYTICMLPICNVIQIKKHRSLKIIVAIAMVFCLSFIFIQDPLFNTIYVETVVAAFVATTLYLAVFSDIKSPLGGVTLALVLSAMLLSKQIGLAFYLLTLFALMLRAAVDMIRHHHAGSEKKSTRTRLWVKAHAGQLFSIALIIFLPLTLSKAWSCYISQFDIYVQFSLSEITPSHIASVVTGQGIEQWRLDGFTASLHAFIDMPLINTNLFSLTYTAIVFASLVMLLLFALLARLTSRDLFWDVILLTFVSFIGSLGYALSISLSYTFGFTQHEAATLASFDRYAGMYANALLLVVFFAGTAIIRRCFSYRIASAALAFVLVLALLTIPPNRLAHLEPALAPGTPLDHKADADLLTASTHEGSKILVISEKFGTGAAYMLDYYAYPRVFRETSLQLSESKDDPQRYVPLYPAGEDDALDNDGYYDEGLLRQTIGEYDYLYIFDLPDGAREKYPDLINGRIKSKTLYSVTGTAEELRLSPIDSLDSEPSNQPD